MSRKDFSDWNGRKRKAILRPSPERDKWLRGGGKKEKVGIKTMVDRYQARLKDVRYWLDARANAKKRAKERGQAWIVDKRPREFDDASFYHGVLRDHIKNLRKLQDHYRREGHLEQVLASLK